MNNAVHGTIQLSSTHTTSYITDVREVVLSVSSESSSHYFNLYKVLQADVFYYSQNSYNSSNKLCLLFLGLLVVVDKGGGFIA